MLYLAIAGAVPVLHVCYAWAFAAVDIDEARKSAM